MKTISILGGNGRLANTAARAFHQAGYKVIVVTRHGQAPRLPADIEQRAADASNVAALLTATVGSDFIFNGLNPPYDKWGSQALPLAQNVIEVARQHGAVHLFPGNVYNYGTTIPAVCGMQTPFQADTSLGKIRVAMEQLFADAAQQHGVKTLVLRAGDFYGDGSTGAWFELAITRKLHKGVFTYPGAWDVVHSWAYLPDLAQALVALAERQAAFGKYETFLFEGHHLTGSEFYDLAQQVLGKPLKKAGIPWWLMKLVGLFSPMEAAIVEMAYLWFRPHQLDGQRLREAIGDLPVTPPSMAIKQALWESVTVLGDQQ